MTDTRQDVHAGQTDPVLVRRARLDRIAKTAKRLGYSLYALAVAVFVLAFATTITAVTATVVIVALVVGSLLLAPAIVIGYGVRAAVREERAQQ